LKKTERHNSRETENKYFLKAEAMKTRTNFRKAVVRSAAVVVSFILISFTVSAQEFWKNF
jgi:hypothetical protein